MQRTQIYLTEEQRRLLGQQATDAGVPMAEIVRRILDDALAIGDTKTARAAAADEAFGALADDETWQDFLARVRRPGGADGRLRELGLS